MINCKSFANVHKSIISNIELGPRAQTLSLGPARSMDAGPVPGTGRVADPVPGPRPGIFHLLSYTPHSYQLGYFIFIIYPSLLSAGIFHLLSYTPHSYQLGFISGLFRSNIRPDISQNVSQKYIPKSTPHSYPPTWGIRHFV